MYEQTTLLQFDDFTVRRYNGWNLNIGDTVWVRIPGYHITPTNGFWATVAEDYETTGDERHILRAWGSGNIHRPHPSNVIYEMVHSCECGQIGGTSWHYCHPDA